jgi:hypothetical protein
VGEFVIGIGTHAGSVWLANVLSAPESRVLFENERLTHWVHAKHWMEYLIRQVKHGLRADDPMFKEYFERVIGMLDWYSVYGDFNSWAPPFIPALCQVVPVSRIVGVMRHGIQQLYSLANSYIWQRVTDEHPLVAGHLHMLWETGGSHGKPWEERTLWEKKCELWASTVYLFDWLGGPTLGLPMEVHRLETLTTDLDYLKCLMYSFARDRSIGDAWLRKMQRTDINRKVWVDRTPINLWRRWKPEQQRAFNEICGDGMRRYGYDLLEVGT